MLKLIVKNSVFNAFSTIFLGVISFFLLPYMLSQLGIVAFGLYTLTGIFAFGGYVSLLEMGFQAAITSYTAQYVSRGEIKGISHIVSSALSLYFAISVLIAIAGMVAVPFLSDVFNVPAEYRQPFSLAMRFVFACYVFQFPNIVFVGLLQGLQRFDIIKGTEVILSFLRALSIIIVLAAGGGLLSVVLVTQISFIIQLFIFIFISKKILPELRISPKNVSSAGFRDIKSMSLLVFVGKIASLASTQTDRILISIFLTPTHLAWYEIASRLPQILKSMLGFVNAVAMPAASHLYSEKKEEMLRALFIRGLRYQVYFSYPFLIGVGVFAGAILHFWVGNDFVHLASLVRLFLILNLLHPWVNYGASLFIGMRAKLRQFTWIALGCAFINLIVSWFLIKRFELYGLVAGTLSGVIFATIISLYYFVKEFRVSLFLLFMEVIYQVVCFSVSALLAGVVWEGSKDYLLGLIFSGSAWIITYFFIQYLIAFKKQDRDLIRNLVLNKLTLN